MAEDQPTAPKRGGVERRAILKGLATGGAVLTVTPPAAAGTHDAPPKPDPAIAGAIEQAALDALSPEIGELYRHFAHLTAELARRRK